MKNASVAAALWLCATSANAQDASTGSDGAALTSPDADVTTADASTVAASVVQPLASEPAANNVAASRAPRASAQEAPVRVPIALFGLLEADYVAPSSEAESLAGLVLHRARMGFTARPLSWLDLRFSGEYARASVGIIDAYATLTATTELEFNVGYQRVPMSPMSRDEPEYALSVPDRAMVVNALAFARDLGVEARWHPRRAPLEAWVRAGNGSGNPLGPETSVPTGIARVDLVLGRAHEHAPREQAWGVRVGIAALVNSVPDRIGIGATTPVGFLFYRPAPIEGLRARLTGHLRVYAGPVLLSVEGGFARDSRSRDTDGNPSTPRVPIDPIYTAGATAELAVMLTGHRRHADEWPQYSRASWLPNALGAIELAARVERLSLSTGATDVIAGGAWGGALAARWWVNAWLVASITAYAEQLDRAPLEAPETTLFGAAVARLTVRVQ